jgi:hypothetical protein
MIKYISVIFFVSFLSWSWSIIHGSPKISFETHAGIQEKLGDLIVQTIQRKLPDAQEIVINQMWTEILTGTSLKAHFNYSFVTAEQEGKVNASITGYVVLEKSTEPNEADTEKETWKVSEVKTTNNALIFEEGLLINTDTISEPTDQ